jgi:DNA-binding transcriptional ArsR family regulator
MSNELQIGEIAGEDFEPAQQMTISNLETLKVAADPTRLRILEILTEKPLTVKQVAHKLDTTPTKLYYHINLLEQHSLITVTASRIVSGIIEKQYRTSAHSLRVSKELLTLSDEPEEGGVGGLLTAIFEATRDDVLRGIRQGLIKLDQDEGPDHNSMMLRTITRLDPEKYHEFYERLKALLTEYKILDESGGDVSADNDADQKCPAYGLTIALYPFAEAEPEE